jgi:hypothetical protein
MHFLIVADAFLPMRTSAAVMLADLAKEFVGQSHQVSMIIPAQDQSKAVSIKMHQGIKVYSVRAFKTKDISYIQRTLAELINPFVIWNRLRSYAEFQECQADAIIWYSPSIFWGPLIKRLKAFFKCKSYLILRDIFPDWALDLGLLKRDLVYFLFKKVAMIGNDMALDSGVGTCGKEGQSVPVGVGQPTLKIDALTVGGTA